MDWRHHAERDALATVLDLWLNGPALRHYVFDVCLNLPPHARVLDLGAKRGVATHALAKRLDRQASLTVVEPVSVWHDDLRRQLANTAPDSTHYLEAPLSSLPVGDASIDVVWAYNLLTKTPEVLLAEMWRVLAPGGVAYLREPEHLYFGLLPPARLLRQTPSTVHFAEVLAEADRGQFELGFARHMRDALTSSMFPAPVLVPLSVTWEGALPPADADVWSRAWSALGMQAEDPEVNPFYLASTFYILEQPGFAWNLPELLLMSHKPGGGGFLRSR